MSYFHHWKYGLITLDVSDFLNLYKNELYVFDFSIDKGSSWVVAKVFNISIQAK